MWLVCDFGVEAGTRAATDSKSEPQAQIDINTKVLEALPPKIERRREGLVEKKILAGAGAVARWEPRHAIFTDSTFLLSRPSADDSLHALRLVRVILMPAGCNAC